MWVGCRFYLWGLHLGAVLAGHDVALDGFGFEGVLAQDAMDFCGSKDGVASTFRLLVPMRPKAHPSLGQTVHASYCGCASP